MFFFLSHLQAKQEALRTGRHIQQHMVFYFKQQWTNYFAEFSIGKKIQDRNNTKKKK